MLHRLVKAEGSPKYVWSWKEAFWEFHSRKMRVKAFKLELSKLCVKTTFQ